MLTLGEQDTVRSLEEKIACASHDVAEARAARDKERSELEKLQKE